MAEQGRPLFLKQANAPPFYPPTNEVSENSQPLTMRVRKRKRRDHSFIPMKEKKKSQRETNGLLKVPTLTGFWMTNTGERGKTGNEPKEMLRVIEL